MHRPPETWQHDRPPPSTLGFDVEHQLVARAMAMTHRLAGGPLWVGVAVVLLVLDTPEHDSGVWSMVVAAGLAIGIQRTVGRRLEERRRWWRPVRERHESFACALSTRTMLVASTMSVLLAWLYPTTSGPLWTLWFVVCAAEMLIAEQDLGSTLERAGVGATTALVVIAVFA